MVIGAEAETGIETETGIANAAEIEIVVARTCVRAAPVATKCRRVTLVRTRRKTATGGDVRVAHAAGDVVAPAEPKVPRNRSRFATRQLPPRVNTRPPRTMAGRGKRARVGAGVDVGGGVAGAVERRMRSHRPPQARARWRTTLPWMRVQRWSPRAKLRSTSLGMAMERRRGLGAADGVAVVDEEMG
jgi:hypothetical protein